MTGPHLTGDLAESNGRQIDLAALDGLTLRIETAIYNLTACVQSFERAADLMSSAANRMNEAAGMMYMARRS